MTNKKSPPGGGTDVGFNLGISPGRGGLAEIPPTWGDLPPPDKQPKKCTMTFLNIGNRIKMQKKVTKMN